jgi:hypothetical protein
VVPSGKAAGPDGIPNEVLKALALHIKEDQARAISELFGKGNLPPTYKKSLTAVLRKDRKDDFQVATDRLHYRTPSRS